MFPRKKKKALVKTEKKDNNGLIVYVLDQAFPQEELTELFSNGRALCFY